MMNDGDRDPFTQAAEDAERASLISSMDMLGTGAAAMWMAMRRRGLPERAATEITAGYMSGMASSSRGGDAPLENDD